jgi:hypothetical protein
MPVGGAVSKMTLADAISAFGKDAKAKLPMTEEIGFV